MLFAQPPRRLPPQPRSFRHQTNSFSFDSTERSSAAYDQERVSSSSTNNSAFRVQREMSLDEELGGASLQRSRTNSEDSASGNSAMDIDDYQLVIPQDAELEPGRGFVFSSPQLPLPPPFSAVPRTISGPQVIPHPEASPIAVPSSTPPRSHASEEQTTPRPASSEVDRADATPRSTVNLLFFQVNSKLIVVSLCGI